MENNPNPLTYHYDSRLKLDYFLLGANVAILGWTIINLDWLPTRFWFEIGIVSFWLLILLSLLLGIFRQIYSSQTFGINFLMVDADERAGVLERNTLNGGVFVDQQTGESTSAENLRKVAEIYRDNQKKFKEKYDSFNDKSTTLGNWSIYLLISGLFLLAILRILAFIYH